MSSHPPTSAFPPPNTTHPQLTLRAIATGMVLGALLTPCNIYSGLKIGWTFNMSITAALLSYAFWKIFETTAQTERWGLLENNINQTTASSAASIISSGLVAPVPALAILTGEQLPWSLLSVWVFSVSLIGIVVAVGLRQQMLIRDRLPFPAGVATAETVREIYGKGGEALARVKVLLTAGGIAGIIKIVNETFLPIPKMATGLAIPLKGALNKAGLSTVSFSNLGFVLDPSLLMVGFGAIIGLRAGLSLLIGAILAWGIIGPWVLTQGWIPAKNLTPDGYWFGPLVEWLLWPGVTLMVMASLTSFACSWGTMVTGTMLSRKSPSSVFTPNDPFVIPRQWFVIGLCIALVFAVVTQMTLFNISMGIAILAVLLSFVLAIVAGRVSGETGITPIGAMGKVTQLTFGFLIPGNVTNNLMAANVTGGAAGQCADLLHDLKTGLLLGASPRFQALAQIFGVLTGSLVGSAVYLVLIPDPQSMLLTTEWPAPAVATWKAVAEVFQLGTEAIPPGSLLAMSIAGFLGVGMVVLGQSVPPSISRWIPSASTMGLAFVIPAWNSLSLFLGALLGAFLMRYAKTWAERFVMALAAGLVAGESLAGVASVLVKILF
ncbi:OPT family oligopeptide transporter [Candidatus Nitrospira neomarina]|uniref:OPT/YSL family transporter n=1 Tax=Candidatus Nitrospira neomarina TaxID=3020899 RepID=A0AA96GQP1_9BACT|nr:OPT family oligopeptide transporter [Candidatus Nitrospira neomarina]WNM62389.1 OPT/YSL family transporter [Candidatus Nitrospira neomarina]